LVEETGVREKTTDLSQVIDILKNVLWFSYIQNKYKVALNTINKPTNQSVLLQS
jgi:hypothetical protein